MNSEQIASDHERRIKNLERMANKHTQTFNSLVIIIISLIAIIVMLAFEVISIR